MSLFATLTPADWALWGICVLAICLVIAAPARRKDFA